MKRCECEFEIRKYIHSSAVPRHALLASRRHTERGHLGVLVVRDDGARVSRALGKFTSVSDLEFKIAADGSLGHGTKRQYVSDRELGLGTGVNEHSGVHSFNGNVKEFVRLELVRVLEVDLSERSSSAWLVDDLLDGTLAVAFSVGIIKSFHLGSSLSQLGVGAENGSSSFSLSCVYREKNVVCLC